MGVERINNLLHFTINHMLLYGKRMNCSEIPNSWILFPTPTLMNKIIIPI